MKLLLRSWRSGDEEALVAIANNRNIWRNMTDRFPHPYTHKDADEWIRIANDDPEDVRNFASIAGGEIVG